MVNLQGGDLALDTVFTGFIIHGRGGTDGYTGFVKG
jgi:hypothetical protein